MGLCVPALLFSPTPTFSPLSASRSRAIAANLTEEKCDKFYSWKPKSTLPSGPVEPDHSPHSHRPKIDSKSQQISQATGWAAIPLHLRLYEQELVKRGVRQKELIARAREAEMVQCTFQPNADTARVALAAALAASVESEGAPANVPNPSHAPVLLHNPGAALFARSVSWAVEKESRLREAREAALRKDVEECTFRPGLPAAVAPRQQRRASISGGGGGAMASLRRLPSPTPVGRGAGGEGRGGRRASLSEVKQSSSSSLGLQQGRSTLMVSPLRPTTAPQNQGGGGSGPSSRGSHGAAAHSQLSQQDPSTQPRPSTLGLDAFVERLKLGRALSYSKKNPALPDGSRWTGEVTRPQAPKLAPGRKGGSRRSSVGGGEFAGVGGGPSAASAHLWGGRQLVNSLNAGYKEDAGGNDLTHKEPQDRGSGGGESAATISSLPTSFSVPSSATAWAAPSVGATPASSSASLPILASIFSAALPSAPSISVPPAQQQTLSVGEGSGAPPPRPPPLPPPVSLRKDASSVEEIKARLRQLESMANSAVSGETSSESNPSLSQAPVFKGGKPPSNSLLSRVEAMAHKVAASI